MSEATVRKQRPKHLALNQIRLPLPGIVSILHRVSGAGLFLLLPFLLYLLDRSLGSAETFETFSAVVDHPLVKLLLMGLLWAYLHHFCAEHPLPVARHAQGPRARTCTHVFQNRSRREHRADLDHRGGTMVKQRIVVGAHYGLKDWIAQRATAVFMAIYTIIFAFSAFTLPELSYEAWSGLFSGGLFRFLSFLFFLSLFYRLDRHPRHLDGLRRTDRCAPRAAPRHPLPAHRLCRLGGSDPVEALSVNVAKRTFDDPLAYRRRAGRHRRHRWPTWAPTTGSGTCTTPSRGRTGWAIPTRWNTCA